MNDNKGEREGGGMFIELSCFFYYYYYYYDYYYFHHTSAGRSFQGLRPAERWLGRGEKGPTHANAVAMGCKQSHILRWKEPINEE